MKKVSLKKMRAAVLAGVLAVALAVTGVLPGIGSLTSKAEDPVAAFVERMYTEVLGRASDAQGKADWTNKLVGHTGDGATLAEGFIMSDEFKGRGVSNEDFLTIMYKTFFNREADEGGYNDWLGKLQAGVSRSEVLAGFVDSAEFAQLCVNYGISQGYMYGNGAVANPGIGLFVYRLYNTLLGRTPDASGVLDWTSRIANNQISAAEAATTGFILSQEFQQRSAQMDNDTYLEVMYATFFDREGDSDGLRNWENQLLAGADRNNIVFGFAGSPEFINLQTSYGLEVKPVQDYVPVEEEDDHLESGDLYWRYIGNKTCADDGTITYETKYLYDENDNYLGYENYSRMKDAEGKWGELKVTSSYKYDRYESGKRKSSTDTNYSWDYNTGELYKSRETVYTYADNDSNDTTSRKEVSYDAKANVTSESETVYENGFKKSSTEKRYVVYDDGTVVLDSTTQSSYNDKGLILQSINDYRTLHLNENWEREYTPSRTVLTYNYEDGNVTTTDIVTTNYDEEGKETTTDKKRRTYKYSAGNLVETYTTDLDDGRIVNKMLYTYNAKGQNISSKSYAYSNNELRLDSVTERDYNINGKQTEYRYYTNVGRGEEKLELTYKAITEYKIINGESYEIRYASSSYDQETQSYKYGNLRFSYGYENEYDDNGFRICYKSYDSDKDYNKELDSYTKYYKFDLADPTEEGQVVDYKYSESFDYDENGNEKRTSYNLETYKAIRIK